MEKKTKGSHSSFVLASILALGLFATLNTTTEAAQIARWNFNDNYNDSWDNDYDATAMNTASFAELGINNTSALRLDKGDSDWVCVYGSNTQDFSSNNFMVSAWVRVLGYMGSTQIIASRYNPISTPKAGWVLYKRANDKWAIRVGSSIGTDGYTLEGSSAVKGQWVFVAATFATTSTLGDGEVEGNLKLYINGALCSQASNVRYKPDSQRSVYIGAEYEENGGTKSHFNGLIDEVRVYSSCLSGNTIFDYYEDGNITTKVMTYNILQGAYSTTSPSLPHNYNYDRADDIIDLIKEHYPDVLILQECKYWADSGNVRLQYFSTQLGMSYYAITETGSSHPHKTVILSRMPIANFYGLWDNNTNFWQNLMDAEVYATSDRKFGIANVHFGWWGVPNWDTMAYEARKQSYIDQKAYLMGTTWLSYHESRNFPYVVGGDWNHAADANLYGQGVLHDQIANMGFGTNIVQQIDSNDDLDPVADTFYVNNDNRFELIDCYKDDTDRWLSDHSPVIMTFLLKN